MVKKTEPFFEGCSSRTCVEVKREVASDYDKAYYRKHKMGIPQPKPKGGAKTVVLEPAQVHIIGRTGKYTVRGHGLAIEARRCREFRYTDRQGEPHTPTCTAKRVYNIPQRTIKCYEQFSELLEALSRGKKGAPPTTSHKMLALLGCNKTGIGKTAVAEPLSPYLIAPIIGIEHNAVRKTMENLVKSKKVTSSYPQLDVVDEKQYKLSPSYAKAFDNFITTEKEERKWIAFRRIFGEEITPETRTLPEATTTSTFTGILRMKPRKLGKRAIARARKEAEEWKRRTMIVQPRYRR